MPRSLPLLALLLALMALGSRVPAPAHGASAGWLLAAQRIEGQYDLVALAAEGTEWQRLLATPDDERHPAISPDGRTVAYAARRDRNWDIYLLELATGEERRLTRDPHYDAFPAFSPDGTRLAFASMREGDLDIFLLDLADGSVTNLTPASPAQEFEPRWQDDRTLLFVSTRAGSQDLYRLTLDGESEALPLATTEERDERGALYAGRRWLALTRDDRRRFLAPVGEPPLISGGESLVSAALSPSGEAVAWLERRLSGDLLYRARLDGTALQPPIGPFNPLEDLTWGQPSEGAMAARVEPLPLRPIPPPPATQEASLTRMEDVEVGNTRLNTRVAAAYTRLRARVAGEVGYDFLGTVSELTRPLDFVSSDSDPLSWHKSGRAVDTLFSMGWRGGIEQMKIVREDWHGDVYWRMWLRCPAQDGSCGEPILDLPWDFNPATRRSVPGQGGIRVRPPAGYYVDFTRLAEDEGWERISAYEGGDFDWRTNTVAMEYWHFQYSHGLRWYQAMAELYDQETLDRYFAPADLAALGIPRWILRAKGIPLPPEWRSAPVEIVQP